jgi:hypothetical protein
MLVTNPTPLAGSQGIGGAEVCAVDYQLQCGTALLLVVLWVSTHAGRMHVKTARWMVERIFKERKSYMHTLYKPGKATGQLERCQLPALGDVVLWRR